MIRCLLSALGLAIFFSAKANPSFPVENSGEPTALCNFVVVPIRTDPTCNGFSDGSISVNIAGDNGPFTYVWQNGPANQPLTGVPAGSYSLTATDSKGCTQVETFTLNEPAPVNVQLSVSPIPCWGMNGGAVHTFVTGGVGNFNYLWSNASVESEILNQPAGTYTVTVSDANGCSTTASTTLTQPDSLHVFVVSMTGFCSGSNTGSITVGATGGTAPYTFVWITNGNFPGPTISNVGPGYFYICVIDANGCQRDLPLTVDPVGILNMNLQVTSAECPGVNTGTATAVVTAGSSSYSYQWNVQPNVTGPQINGLAPGTVVTVTVTDNLSQCQSTATATIGAHNQVIVQVTDTDVQCATDPSGTATASATQGTTPYTYVWTIPGTGTVNGPTVSNLVAGAYSVTATDARGCTGIGVADIGANSNLKADFKFTPLECVGDSVKVLVEDNSSVTGSTITSWSWNIVWSNGSTTSTNQNPGSIILPENETGTIQVTVASANGCTATISKPFKVDGNPEIQLSVTSPAVFCFGQTDTIFVTGSASYNYVWSPTTHLTMIPGTPNVIPNPPTPTMYTLTVENGNCKKEVPVMVKISPDFNLNATDDIITCDAAATLTATSNGSVMFKWYKEMGILAGTNATLQVNTGTIKTYTVVATDGEGCSKSEEVTVTGIGPDISLSGNQPSDCENVAVNVVATNLDTTDVNTYAWTSSPPGLNINPTNALNPTISGPAGTYNLTLTVTNQNNCTRAYNTAITFSNATASAKVTADLCNGTEVAFTSNVPGSWNFGDGNISSVINPTHNYAAAGPYTVVFTPANLACSKIIDTTINVLPTPAVEANFGQDLEDCRDVAIFHFTDSTKHSDPIVSWNWSFPPFGVTSSEQNPTLTFTNPGPMDVILVVTDVNGCKDADTLKALPFHIIKDDIAPEQDLCKIDKAIALNPVFNTDYVYNWTSSPNDPTLTDPSNPNPNVLPSQSTTYYVMITLGGCVVLDTVEVNSTPIDDTVGPEIKTCENTAVELNPTNSPTYQYQWASIPPGESSLNGQQTFPNPIVNPTSATVYVVTITYGNCTHLDTVAITPGAVAENIEDAETKRCPDEKISLNEINLPGHGYSWSSVPPDSNLISQANNPNPMVMPSVPTTYYVTITAGNCTKQDSIKVVPVIFEEKVEKDEDDLCPDETVELNPINLPGYSYDWSNNVGASQTGSPNPTVSPTDTTTYTVVITKDDCPFNDTITVFPIAMEEIIEDKKKEYCENDSVALNALNLPGYTFNWTSSPNDPTLVSSSNNPVVSPTVTTIYQVLITKGSCELRDTIEVIPNEAAVVVASDDKVVCSDSTVTISVISGNGQTYVWANNPNFQPPMGSGTTVNVTPIEGGIYYVQATTAEGCKSIDSVKIDNQKVCIGYDPARKICLGESTMLEIENCDTTQTLQYQWNPGGTGGPQVEVNPTSDMSFNVSVSNTAGCGASAKFDVDVVSIAASIKTAKETTCPGEELLLDLTPTGGGSGYSFDWDNASTLDDSEIEDPTASPEVTTTYTVTVTDKELGCETTASKTVEVIILQCQEPFIFVPKVFTPNGDEKNDFFMVRGMNIRNVYFVVYDRWGEEVFKTESITSTGWDGTYKGETLPPDSYGWYLKVDCDGGEEYVAKGDVTLLK